MTETIQKILNEIRGASSFLVTSHVSPDGDAVGSSLALASFLRRIGKEVCVHFRDPVPELYAFLPGSETVQSHIPDRDFDLAFVLDVGDLSRAERNSAAVPALASSSISTIISTAKTSEITT